MLTRGGRFSAELMSWNCVEDDRVKLETQKGAPRFASRPAASSCAARLGATRSRWSNPVLYDSFTSGSLPFSQA